MIWMEIKWNCTMTLVFGMIPRIILGPVAGVVSDRVDRKKLLVLMDLVSGIIVFGLVGVAVIEGLEVRYIYIANLLLNTCNTFFDIPMGASIPNIVDNDNLVKTNSLNHAVSSMAQILGPFLGGLVFAFIDIKLFLIINASSFIVSGVSEIFIDFNLNKKDNKDQRNYNKQPMRETRAFIKELNEGLRFIKGKNVLSIMFGFAIFINFFVSLGISVPYPYIINDVIKMSSTKFGVLEAMLPLGMLLGSITISLFKEKEKNITL
ncbi:MFS transporter [Clostridium bovifaecis]|uniref:MFS transporter n=1 Tax=Clostridium bovifaecis TaxID=2184719 RepID=A0A6I6EVR0_9CLOT|nr:MFS transporter [Clostridium bovifaecis]